MSHVPKHYSEKERKSDSCENGWVHFLVTRDSVGVSNFLSDNSVAIGIKGCGRFGDRQFLKLGSWQNSADSSLEPCLFRLRKVDISYKEVFFQEHLVESVVDEVFFPQEKSPSLDRVTIADGVQVFVHLLLVQFNQIHGLFELFAALPHFLCSLLSLLELEE